MVAETLHKVKNKYIKNYQFYHQKTRKFTAEKDAAFNSLWSFFSCVRIAAVSRSQTLIVCW